MDPESSSGRRGGGMACLIAGRLSLFLVVLLFNNRIHFCLRRAYAHSRSGCLGCAGIGLIGCKPHHACPIFWSYSLNGVDHSPQTIKQLVRASAIFASTTQHQHTLSPFSLAYTEFLNKAPLAVLDTPRLPFHERTAHSLHEWMIANSRRPGSHYLICS